MMPESPDPRMIRQAAALLATHLRQRREGGEKTVWLKPGLDWRGAGTKAQRLAKVETQAKTAAAPKELGTLRDAFVFATGNPEAELVFVGEAPGSEEERLGEPFVGPAGELLDKALVAMGLSRPEVYITNIVKYRPLTGDGDQGRANRKPTREEMESCLPFVRKEISIVRPKVVVALGGTAYSGLTGDYESTVGSVRGRFLDFGGRPLMVTYHPSYLLRNPAKGEKRKFWLDLLQVMEKLGMPISDRQRGFFT